MPIGTDGQSFKGYCGIAEETAYGDGGSPSAFLPIRSDGFGAGNNPLYQSNIRGRDRYAAAAGMFDDDGDAEMVAGPENGLGYLLKAAFGSTSVSTSDESGDSTDDTGTHTFSPADDLPSLAVEIGLGSIDAAQHVGVGVDTLEFSHTPEEYLVVTAGMTAKEFELQGSQASPTYSDLRPFVWHDGTITVESTDRTADIAEFTAELSNNIDEKIRGERSPTKAHTGQRVISGNLNLDFENTDVAELFLGSVGATSPEGGLKEVELQATWTSPEVVAGSKNYELDLHIPNVRLETYDANLNEQEAIVENVAWGAVMDSGNGYDMEATLVNGITSSY